MSDTPAEKIVDAALLAANREDDYDDCVVRDTATRRHLIKAVAAELDQAERIRELIARFMISFGIATGHGDTAQDLLSTFGAYVDELRTEVRIAKQNGQAVLEMKQASDDREEAALARVKELEQANKELIEALQSLPLDAFDKPMEEMDAADFVDNSAAFIDAMELARAALSKHGGTK